jgi:maltose/moltooligosaccharide transporter
MAVYKPRLNFWQIWNMGFGFLGIQFGFALQNANTSRIFSALGAADNELAVLWLAAPVTGLLVQPIIGYYSDRTWSRRWGRRRPYFAIGAILASISLCMMPNAPALWVAAGTLWIMDASINISMEPFRAFVGDLLPPSQRTTGFAMQSFFIGTGAIVASWLPFMLSNWLLVSNTPGEGEMIADSVKYSFYAGAFVLFASVMWTVFSTEEYPPDQKQIDLSRKGTIRKIEDEGYFRQRFVYTGISFLSVGLLTSALVFMTQMEKELYVLTVGFVLFGLLHFVGARLIRKGSSHLGIVHMLRDFHTMPSTMVRLAVVQFFSWFALFAMWIYTTPAVTSFIYHSTDPRSAAYNEGANMVGNLFGMYNGVAAIAALILPIIARYTSRRVTHLIALSCGGLGLISFFFISDPSLLYYSMTGVGIAWASILSIPYAMLSGALPSEKMGYYMGVFNFFIVIPQIIAATILGILLTRVFDGQSIYLLVAGGVSMILAGLLCLLVKDEQHVVMSA